MLDPTDPLIFNCGMGVVRSKLGQVRMAAYIRKLTCYFSNCWYDCGANHKENSVN